MINSQKHKINWWAWWLTFLFLLHIVTTHTLDEIQMNITNNLEFIFGL